ncbi:MAG TPA: hypothetical protein VGN55_16525 [Xanthobacteraceae bacterium]|jgi:hypothetical protein
MEIGEVNGGQSIDCPLFSIRYSPVVGVFHRRTVWQKLIQKPISKTHCHDKTYPEDGTKDTPLNKSAVRRKIVGKWLEADIPTFFDGPKDRKKNSGQRESDTAADARPHCRPKRLRGQPDATRVSRQYVESQSGQSHNCSDRPGKEKQEEQTRCHRARSREGEYPYFVAGCLGKVHAG